MDGLEIIEKKVEQVKNKMDYLEIIEKRIEQYEKDLNLMMQASKKLAIIFIVLFLAETSIIVYAVATNEVEIGRLNNCYFGICAYYPDASYSDSICTCSDYNDDGELVVVLEEYMK